MTIQTILNPHAAANNMGTRQTEVSRMSISNCTAHQKNWQHWRINPAQAQAFYSAYWDGELPPGIVWHWVAGLQYCPRGWDYSYLVAGSRGLEGILGRAGG